MRAMLDGHRFIPNFFRLVPEGALWFILTVLRKILIRLIITADTLHCGVATSHRSGAARRLLLPSVPQVKLCVVTSTLSGSVGQQTLEIRQKLVQRVCTHCSLSVRIQIIVLLS